MSTETAQANIFQLDGIAGYPSYLHHLGQNLVQPDFKMNAIIVPQGRPAPKIESAARLARASGAMLISLCSHKATASEVDDFLADMGDEGPGAWFAVDVPPGYKIPHVKMNAAQSIPKQCQKEEGSNLSVKRNIGLLVSRMVDWDRIFFEDDDQTIDEDALHDVSLMMYGRHIAGLRCGAFPDKSVIEHGRDEILRFHLPPEMYEAESNLKAGQISANSMGVNPGVVNDYFPEDIYNEDWFFAFKSIRDELAALSEHYYYQDAYDPFDPERARTEEFGDIYAEGLYEAMDMIKSGQSRLGALYTTKYWQPIIENRRNRFEELIKRLDAKRNPSLFNDLLTPEQMEQTMRDGPYENLALALDAGLRTNETLSGSDFVMYAHALAEEKSAWKRMLGFLTKKQSVKDALNYLKLYDIRTNQ